MVTRHAFKDMWAKFENTDVKNYENIKNLEKEALFPFASQNQTNKKYISPYDSLKKNEKIKYDESKG